MSKSKDNLSAAKRHVTAKIITYIFIILFSLALVVFIILISGSKEPKFIATVGGLWFFFFLFCLYKINHAKRYKGVFQKGMLSVTELDNMDGIAFEELACDILIANGFDVAENTQATCDYGVDILASKEGITYAIQCKRYLEPVGIEAVQQVYAGRAYYECHVAVVLTNQMFTTNAKNLADKIGVVLWDRETLRNLL